MTGAEMIAAERERQVSVEGWTAEHDDAHVKGELTSAAICYAAYAVNRIARPDADPISEEMYRTEPGAIWPWNLCWFKPEFDPIVNLKKAGALIAAEIDRPQRK